MNYRYQAHDCCSFAHLKHRLHEEVRKVISAWFNLVDDDSSGGLDSHELMAALKV